MIFSRTLLLASIAATLLVSFHTTNALPTYGLRSAHRGHARRSNALHHSKRDSNDRGNVAAHDDFEAQVHALEAALQHYEQFGDQQSLETYLKGFTSSSSNSGSGSGNGGSSNGSSGSGGSSSSDSSSSSSSGGAGKQGGSHAGSSEGHSGQDGDGCDDDQQETKPNPQPQPQTPKPSQNQPKMQKQPKQQPQPSNDYTQPQPQQSKPQPEQPKVEQPKIEQPKPQPQPQQPVKPPPSESYNPNPSPPPPKSDDSINGYTPPPFSTSQSPSISSLYTMSSPFTGRATFYNAGLGACGIVNSDNDPIVAVSKDLFEQYNPSSGNPNHNSLCGKKIEVSWKGKKVQAFATDECPTCEKTSLDMSPTVFDRLDNRDKGVLDGITWRFI